MAPSRVAAGTGSTAIVFRDQRMSYRELEDRVTRLAHALADLGVHRGDRVALLSANHPVYLEALFAAGLLGAILVPLNARLTAPEVTYALTDSGATVLIHSADLGPVASAAAHDAGTSRRVVVDGDPDDDALGYEQLIADADGARIDIPVGHEEPCFIMYTSGTTGNPKGVVLTHGGVTFAVLNPILDLDIASDEVSLVVAPLFHTAAMNFVSLPTILKGGTLIIHETFDPGRALSVFDEQRVTYSFCVPTMLDAMSAHPNWAHADLSSIRRLIVAAAPVPPHTLHTYTERGVALCQAYGLTETGPGALILRPAQAERKLGSAGVPHFFTDVRVVDADAVILSCPGVVGCGVFGIPDEKWDEVGCAAVTLAEGSSVTADDIAAWAGERLARYKIPRSFVVLDEIPRNATGKIRKDRLRAMCTPSVSAGLVG
ncbi:AMP-binding protein [Gordonia bronchialis]|uniref:AMP-binding protein n=1 Tax=Gordonia bronchialis TaxID=2054 RepID=UPI00226DBAB5|nr:AMP-binding protein [Gordonia bronchialis]